MKNFHLYLVARLEPVTTKQREIPSRRIVGNGNTRPGVDIESAEPASSAVHRRRREVRKAPDLILGLKLVRVVRARRNGAVRSEHSILPRVLSHLDSVPSDQKRLIELIDHVDDDVVVGHAVQSWPGELAIDENTLQKTKTRHYKNYP